MECERLKVDIIYKERVTKISEPDYTVNTMKPDKTNSVYYGKKLILATGGCASPKLGSDGSGYLLAKAYGHRIIKPLPALVSLKSHDKFCKVVSGVRTWAKASLYIDNENRAEEEGEIIFTDYGISGIPIMQMSRFASRALDEGSSVFISLDLFAHYSRKELTEMFINRCISNPDKTLEQMMVGIFNQKLNYIIIKEAGFNPDIPCHMLNKSDVIKLARLIKGLVVRIKDTNTFDFAQATSGGVSTEDIDPNTLESRIKKGLYFIGELLDVDGTCGGYNLQWAWSTGYIAGSHAGTEVLKN